MTGIQVSQDLLSEVLKGENRIREHLNQTPVITSPVFSAQTQGKVHLKLENRQVTGSFKVRGALNALLALNEDNDDFYPVTASTGNHALGFSWGLQKIGKKGLIVLPFNTVPSKMELLNSFDVDIKQFGENCDEAEEHAKKLARENGWIWISPYNDPLVIGGQGTIAVELFRQLKSIDNIFVTVGGGGMISGIATYAKTIHPGIRIIGCQPENSAEMALSFKTGKHKTAVHKPTLSDGSAGGFEDGAVTFDVCRNLVDEFILVSEEEIKNAILAMAARQRMIIEGAAAVALASLIKEKERFSGQQNVVILCGGNLSPLTLKELIDGER